jgi:lactate racemase
MTNLLKSRSRAWFEDVERTYSFPENWNIHVYNHGSRRVLGPNEIRNEIQDPIGCLPLTSYLTPGMKICIVCDDISRPTRTDIILPIILDIFKVGGIHNQNIQIVIASGAHSKMTKEEKIVKFGKKVCQEINIVDHDYNEGGVYIGTTELGTPVYVNQAVANSDFILGIGGIYPNSVAGFGGGAKLILGVCGINTIRHFHFRRRGINRGEAIINDFRNDLLDAARICGMKFIINNLISEDREIIGIVAGDVEQAYLEGLKTAQDIYAVTDPSEFDFDLIVADTYPFDLSYVYAKKGFWPFTYCRPNCHRLIIADISAGVGYHGLFPPYHSGI